MAFLCNSVAVNPDPLNTMASSFFQRGVLVVTTICGIFPSYTECSMKSLSQLPAPLESRLLKVSPQTLLWGRRGVSLGGFPCCCAFCELEGKTRPYFDSNESVVWVYNTFSWHTRIFIKLPYIGPLGSRI